MLAGIVSWSSRKCLGKDSTHSSQKHPQLPYDTGTPFHILHCFIGDPCTHAKIILRNVLSCPSKWVAKVAKLSSSHLFHKKVIKRASKRSREGQGVKPLMCVCFSISSFWVQISSKWWNLKVWDRDLYFHKNSAWSAELVAAGGLSSAVRLQNWPLEASVFPSPPALCCLRSPRKDPVLISVEFSSL